MLGFFRSRAPAAPAPPRTPPAAAASPLAAAVPPATEGGRLACGTALRFSRGETAPQLRAGWWETEEGFVWSKGQWCEIGFAFDTAALAAARRAELSLDIDAFKHPSGPAGQTVRLYLNGLRIGTCFIAGRCEQRTPFAPHLLRAEENVLTLDTPEAASPAQFGLADGRVLGVQLFSVTIGGGS